MVSPCCSWAVSEVLVSLAVASMWQQEALLASSTHLVQDMLMSMLVLAASSFGPRNAGGNKYPRMQADKSDAEDLCHHEPESPAQEGR